MFTSNREALKLAGRNSSIFKGHSIGVEFSSKASKAGFSLADILARSSLFRSSTLQIFYKKQIMNENNVYQKTVFGRHEFAL